MADREPQAPALWTTEERTWARECYHAGDSLAEIAEAAGRSVRDVQSVLGSGGSITAFERACLSLYTSGSTFDEIAGELGYAGPNARKIPAAAISHLRRKGIPVPYRSPGVAAARRPSRHAERGQ